MPTLQDILEKDLGLEPEQEKIAQEEQTDDIEKLATELHLFDEPSTEQPQPALIKEATMSMDHLYENYFPGDADVVQPVESEKVAMDKEAEELEEAIGARAYDYFGSYVDGHISKLAAALVSNAESTAAVPNNAVNTGKAISTDPEVQDDAMNDKVEGEVGAVKSAAVRKHMLLAQLEA